jgi:hypothetical protein
MGAADDVALPPAADLTRSGPRPTRSLGPSPRRHRTEKPAALTAPRGRSAPNGQDASAPANRPCRSLARKRGEHRSQAHSSGATRACAEGRAIVGTLRLPRRRSGWRCGRGRGGSERRSGGRCLRPRSSGSDTRRPGSRSGVARRRRRTYGGRGGGGALSLVSRSLHGPAPSAADPARGRARAVRGPHRRCSSASPSGRHVSRPRSFALSSRALPPSPTPAFLRGSHLGRGPPVRAYSRSLAAAPRPRDSPSRRGPAAASGTAARGSRASSAAIAAPCRLRGHEPPPYGRWSRSRSRSRSRCGGANARGGRRASASIGSVPSGYVPPRGRGRSGDAWGTFPRRATAPGGRRS